MNKTVVSIIGALVLCVGGVSVYAALNQPSPQNQSIKQEKKSVKSKKDTNPTKKSTRTGQKKPSKATKTEEGMNLSQIKSGDFSSVTGTWTNPEGNSFIFDKTGLTTLINSGTTIPNQKVYIDTAKIENNILTAKLGADPLPTEGASITVPFNFIPKNVDFDGSTNKSQDRIYSGQQFGEQNIYVLQKQASTDDLNNINKLTAIDKQTLALLGLPSGFVSDYGDLTADTIFSGNSNVTSNAEDSAHYDINNGKISSVDFSGVKLTLDGDKNIVKLNNLPSTVNNVSYKQG